ncbi:hypothetical protein HZB08_00420, partial [Candidatus Saganbacteria bacterium]|nr:hypothetical protein [Candidatus Saganbacteria bacterium]
MRIKIPFRLVLFGFLGMIVLLLWPANPFDLSEIKIMVPEGASVRAVQRRLRRSGILPSWSAFLPAVRLLGAQNKIKAGEYLFSPSESLPRVVIKLLMGGVIPPQTV